MSINPAPEQTEGPFSFSVSPTSCRCLIPKRARVKNPRFSLFHVFFWLGPRPSSPPATVIFMKFSGQAAGLSNFAGLCQFTSNCQPNSRHFQEVCIDTPLDQGNSCASVGRSTVNFLSLGPPPRYFLFYFFCSLLLLFFSTGVSLSTPFQLVILRF
ncbi:hypothetical protein VTK26DRAFT_2888 [Humicola hyalothermophila]